MFEEQKMDIFKFIDSLAIREHLKSINYEFSSVEAAWLVWQCRTAALEEKHAAWREIIDKTTDMRVDFACAGPFESLHGFLKDYIALERRRLDRFFQKESNAVYEYQFYFSPEDAYGGHERLFSDYDACLDDIKKERGYYADGEIDHVRIRKRFIDGTNDYVLLTTPDETVKSIEPERAEDELEDDLSCAFNNMWFAFPTPFSPGDIVYDPESAEGFCEGPFALMATASDIYRRTKEKMCDVSDMLAFGYFQDRDGQLYYECMHGYMHLEYYPEKRLVGKRRILRSLGNLLKGDINEVQFAGEYHRILTEED